MSKLSSTSLICCRNEYSGSTGVRPEQRRDADLSWLSSPGPSQRVPPWEQFPRSTHLWCDLTVTLNASLWEGEKDNLLIYRVELRGIEPRTS